MTAYAQAAEQADATEARDAAYADAILRAAVAIHRHADAVASNAHTRAVLAAVLAPKREARD